MKTLYFRIGDIFLDKINYPLNISNKDELLELLLLTKKMSRQKTCILEQPVYLFDMYLNIIKKFKTTTECANFTKTSKGNIQIAIRRESFIKSKYYVSRNEKFEYPKRKSERNPLFNKRGNINIA
jgi:hypothetical protein